MGGQIQLVISMVLIGLFSIAIIGFAIQFAVDNNAAIDISDDAEISNLFDNSKSNISGFGNSSEDTYSSILNTTVEPGSQTVPSTAPFAITPFNALGIVKSILFVTYGKIFGTGAGFGIFLTAFVGVIVFMLGLLIYKTLRGNPN